MPELALIKYVKDHWEVFFVIIVLILWTIGCVQQGERWEKAKWDASILKAAEEARVKEQNATTLNNVTEGKSYVGIKAIDDSYNAAVDSMLKSSSNMPKIAGSPCFSNGKTISNEIYRATQLKELKDKRAAEIQTNQLLLWQEWYPAVQREYNK